MVYRIPPKSEKKKALISSHAAATWSLSFRPLVSRGKYDTAMPEASITVMNIRIAAIWWHACTRPTATRGHRIPPNRAIELANPTPVALTAVGYICKEHGIKRKQCSEVFIQGFMYVRTHRLLEGPNLRGVDVKNSEACRDANPGTE